MQDRPGQILALASRYKFLTPLRVFPIRSKALWAVHIRQSRPSPPWCVGGSKPARRDEAHTLRGERVNPRDPLVTTPCTLTRLVFLSSLIQVVSLITLSFYHSSQRRDEAQKLRGETRERGAPSPSPSQNPHKIQKIEGVPCSLESPFGATYMTIKTIASLLRGRLET